MPTLSDRCLIKYVGHICMSLSIPNISSGDSVAAVPFHGTCEAFFFYMIPCIRCLFYCNIPGYHELWVTPGRFSITWHVHVRERKLFFTNCLLQWLLTTTLLFTWQRLFPLIWKLDSIASFKNPKIQSPSHQSGILLFCMNVTKRSVSCWKHMVKHVSGPPSKNQSKANPFFTKI